ncbi:MAG TPA: hypothetical protein VMT53_10675 [Terriglobales bacterium]|nr:hypothetical protein [Terriglobales bacterium]
MYSGRLIEQLMATVERVEKKQRERETSELERLYLAESIETVRYEQDLVGVA